MATQMPTAQEIEELVSFLPRLYAEGVNPIEEWSGGSKSKDGVLTMAYPTYNRVVKEFFEVASSACWADYGYDPGEAGRMLEDEDFVKTANLAQIKTMLTFCVRGERFCDGHWGSMVKAGHIRRLLERLAELR